MWTEYQRDILSNLCIDTEASQYRKSILDTGNLECNGIPITIFPGTAPVSFSVYVQLGVPPAAEATSIYRRLLELNLMMGPERTEKLALDPTTGMALFSYAISPKTSDQLRNSLQLAVGRAAEWQLNFFLSENDGLEAI
jgi:hypothetical protein